MSKLKRPFTDAFLVQLSGGDARLEYADTQCQGLVVRKNKNGSKTFSVIFRVKGAGGVNKAGQMLCGKQQRITLGPYPVVSLDNARREALQIRIRAYNGEDPRQDRRAQNLARSENSFKAVSEQYIEKYAKLNTVGWRNAERVFQNYAVPFFGSRPIDKVTRSDIHNLLDRIVTDGKTGTAREVKRHLCTLYNWAINRELCSANPALNLVRKDLKPNEEAGRSLQDDEIKAIWRATQRMGYPFGPIFQLLLLTGQRKSDWACARSKELNWSDTHLEIARARYKGRRDHIVPMSPVVKSVVEALPEWADDNYFLFSTQGGKTPVSGFAKAKQRLDGLAFEEMVKITGNPKAKLAAYRIHDFRVTCETRLANLGFNQEIRDRILGHAAPGLQKTYNKYDYGFEKREALEAYARHILKLADA